MSNMNRILNFAKRVETSAAFGGCPVDKLFMTDTLSYSDIFIVQMGEEFDKASRDVDCMHKLRVEVVMRRARYEYESKWRHNPNQFATGMLVFYHTDFDEMLSMAADYLEAHYDALPGLYEAHAASTNRRATLIKCVKHEPIGRVIHISEDPDYAKYWLE